MKKGPICFLLIMATCIVLFPGCGNPNRPTFKVRYDDIVSRVQATGVIEASQQKNINADFPLKFETIHISLGDYVQKGERIATINQAYIEERINAIHNEISESLKVLNNSPTKKNIVNIKSPSAGRVKNIAIKSGDDLASLQNKEPVLLISTKREMNFWIQTNSLSLNDTVDVVIGNDKVKGKIAQINGHLTKVVIGSDSYIIGSEAKVFIADAGDLYGKLELSSFIPVICEYGTVSKISVSENGFVKQMDTLFSVLKYTDEIYSMIDNVRTNESILTYYNALKSNPIFVSDFEGIITLIPNCNDEYQKSQIIFSIASNDSVFVRLLVDEFDIQKVDIGQKVRLSVDSTSDQIADGIVSSVSHYSETKEGESWAKFAVNVQLSSTGRYFVGSRVFGSITINETKNVLIIPLSAIYQTDGKQYVLADIGKDSELFGKAGAELPQNAVIIKTGVQSGEYAEVMYGLVDGMTIFLD